MRASEVISALQQHGVTLKAVAGSLKIGGVDKLTVHEKAALKAHKASILKALAATPSQPTATAGATPVAPALAATAASFESGERWS